MNAEKATQLKRLGFLGRSFTITEGVFGIRFGKNGSCDAGLMVVVSIAGLVAVFGLGVGVFTSKGSIENVTSLYHASNEGDEEYAEIVHEKGNGKKVNDAHPGHTHECQAYFVW